MKYYIQGPTLCKAQYIVSEYDGKIIRQPKSFDEIVSDEALVCVIDNGPFDVAIYCDNASIFDLYTDPVDIRKKRWLVMDRDTARKLSGYIDE